MRSMVSLIAALLLVAQPAWARFGKAGSGGSSGSHSSGSSSSGGTHASHPVGGGSSSSGGSSSGSYRGGGYYGGSYGPGYGYRYGYGFFGGAFVPYYGYGYGYGYGYPYGTPGYAVTSGVPAAQTSVNVRATAGADFLYMVGNANKGFTLGINGAFEFERWGFNAMAQNIAVAADDGSGGVDNLQQVNAHLTFAFLSGTYGRMRIEAGADTIFAPSAVFFGPSLGLSGVLWIAGPFAFESSVYGTVYPFWQLDWKAALVIGAGPVGFKLGWRTQVLDDRGTVDGVTHRDVYMGPYAGIGFAF